MCGSCCGCNCEICSRTYLRRPFHTRRGWFCVVAFKGLYSERGKETIAKMRKKKRRRGKEFVRSVQKKNHLENVPFPQRVRCRVARSFAPSAPSSQWSTTSASRISPHSSPSSPCLSRREKRIKNPVVVQVRLLSPRPLLTAVECCRPLVETLVFD